MIDRDTYAPLVFMEYDHKPGSYCLMLTDDKMHPATDLFEAAGYQGGGYDWAGVARSAVATRAPELADRLGFDPEAGMFVAYGEDAEALKKLGTLLRDAFHNRAMLKELIEAGDPDWFD